MLNLLELQYSIKRRTFLGLAIFILFIVILEIWAANRLITFGEKMSQIEVTKAALKMENQVLVNQISERSSLSNLKNFATRLGFDKVKKIEYIRVDDDSKTLTVNAR